MQWLRVLILTIACLVLFVQCTPCKYNGTKQCEKIGQQVVDKEDEKNELKVATRLAKACERYSEAACREIGRLFKEEYASLSKPTITAFREALVKTCSVAPKRKNKTDFCALAYEVTTETRQEWNTRSDLCGTQNHVASCASVLENLGNGRGYHRWSGLDVITGKLHATSGCAAGDEKLCEIKEDLKKEQERRERREKERKERDQRVESGIQSGTVDCNEWAYPLKSQRRVQMCEYLAETVREGRTSSRARRYMQRYLRDDLGVRQISAYMIADLGDDTYEAVMLGYSSYFSTHYPKGKHFILNATVTRYGSKGRFKSWVTKTGTREIQTKDGFYETWNVYKESKVGGLWGLVRSARAGHATSSAARDMLRVMR